MKIRLKVRLILLDVLHYSIVCMSLHSCWWHEGCKLQISMGTVTNITYIIQGSSWFVCHYTTQGRMIEMEVHNQKIQHPGNTFQTPITAWAPRIDNVNRVLLSSCHPAVDVGEIGFWQKYGQNSDFGLFGQLECHFFFPFPPPSSQEQPQNQAGSAWLLSWLSFSLQLPG